jgi:hypothetical protein
MAFRWTFPPLRRNGIKEIMSGLPYSQVCSGDFDRSRRFMAGKTMSCFAVPLQQLLEKLSRGLPRITCGEISMPGGSLSGHQKVAAGPPQRLITSGNDENCVPFLGT